MPRLRLATFNLESLGAFETPEPGEAPLPPARLEALRPLLLRLDADVVCLQEVNAQHPAEGGPRAPLALEALLGDTPYATYERVVTVRPDRGTPADVHNLVILSKFPVASSAQPKGELVDAPTWRPRTTEPPAGEAIPITPDRPVQHAVLEVGTRRLHVINVHLRAPRAAPIPGQKLDAARWRSCAGWAEGAFVAVVKRAVQALEVRLLCDRIFDAEPEAAIAVCGDFNCEAREMPARIIAADEDETGNPALGPRALAALDGALPEERRFSVLHGGARLMLDHVLASRSLAEGFVRAEVFAEGLVDEARATAPVDGSTHAPLCVELAWPRE